MIDEMFRVQIAGIRLKILVFGPNPTTTSGDPHVLALGNKRNQIRAHLVADGHDVHFPEEMVNPNIPAPGNNPVLQEILLAKSYDAIVHLVQTPGTQVELGLFCTRQDVCRKLQLFICGEYRSGLAYGACKMSEALGATLSEYTFPTDLDECHLLTSVSDSVRRIQMAKFLNPN